MACAQEVRRPSPSNPCVLPLLLCGLLGRLVTRAHAFVPGDLKYLVVFAQKLLYKYNILVQVYLYIYYI